MLFKELGIKSKNIQIIGFSQIIGGMVFFLPILALYLEQQLFTATNVALIFAIQSIATAILEVPTGAFADLFGRKHSVILGQIAVFLGLVALAIGGHIIFFVLFAVLNATGRALMSGSDTSLIYDTLLEENKAHHFKKVMSTFYALWPLGAIVGSLAGGYFATYTLKLPIQLSLIPIGVVLILSFFIKEPVYHKPEHKNIAKQMWEASKDVIANKQLVLLMLSGLILLAFGESAHQLKPLFFAFKNIPIAYFGVVFAFTFGFSSIGHYLSHAFAERFGDKRTLIGCAIAFPLFLYLATLFDGSLSMVLIVLTSIPFGLRNPVTEHLLNLEISSSKRATVLSINNLLENIGLALGTPFLGYFADLWSINTAYQIAAGLMVVAVLFLLFVRDHKGHE